MKLIGSKENFLTGSSIFSDRSQVSSLSSRKTSSVPEHLNTITNFDYSLLNIASTPTMRVNDFRLCLFFFHYIVNDEKKTKIDNIYSLTDKDVTIRTIGQDGAVYVLNPDDEELECYKMPFKSLHNKLSKANIHIPIDELEPTIQKLHDLGYLTITKICSANAQEDGPTPIETNCVLIKVNYFVSLTPQNKHWKISPT